MALSTDKILGAVLAKIEEMSPRVCGNYLDIGATRGHLIRLVSHKFGVTATACDYTRELIRIPGLKIDLVDLNHDLLPYPEAHFDLVTCTEVIEHIEHYRHTIREIFRVLKPGALRRDDAEYFKSARARAIYFWFLQPFWPPACSRK